MRQLILLGVLIAATACALPACAAHVYIHGTRNMLLWHTTDGRALDFTSPGGKGIHVEHIEPVGHDGLKVGDVITAVDGQPVANVIDLVTYANAHQQAACTLTVRRGQADQQLALPAGELTALVHPQP